MAPVDGRAGGGVEDTLFQLFPGRLCKLQHLGGGGGNCYMLAHSSGQWFLLHQCWSYK